LGFGLVRTVPVTEDIADVIEIAVEFVGTIVAAAVPSLIYSNLGTLLYCPP
jgi:hypothetical protein